MSTQSYMDLIRAEIGGIYGQAVLGEMDEILRFYRVYDGKETQSAHSAVGQKARTNWIKKLINDESRYMCARPPELRVMPRDAADQEAADALTEWLEDMLDRNGWGNALLRGVRDALIGKRVALKLAYEEGVGVRLRFAPSLEFVYEPDEAHLQRIQKAVFFYATTPETEMDKTKQRIWKQRYRMEGGRCRLDEGVYDGLGRAVDVTHEDADTGLDFIPAYVIINGGLTGDLLGESDVAELIGNQDAYNQIKADDLDALKYQMFGQKVFIDCSPESIQAVKIAPNAMIDLQTDPSSAHQARAEVLETSFAYGDHMDNTLSRIKDDMHALMSVPQITPDLLTGLGTSGKAMRALYWDLNCRCEEKWSCGWDAAITWMVESAMRMARAYGERLPEIDYTLSIEHLYPIIDDDEEERAQDLMEVGQQARSRRSYIEKWQTDADPDGELRQIQTEQRLMEDSFAGAIRQEMI